MMKISRIISICAFWLTGALSLQAIPPAPGLDLQEPQRPRIPFEVQTQLAGKRCLVNQHALPAINLEPRGLLIVASFPDIEFAPVNTHQAFDSLANGADYTYAGATGSCQSYFAEQSNGQYVPQFDVIGPVKLPHPSDYYGTDTGTDNDRYIVDFVMDACKGADDLGVDFSQYDNDQDGIIDFVYIIYAGFGQADGGDSTTIWPHNWDLISALYFNYTNQQEYYAHYNDSNQLVYNLPSYDGKLLYSYACSSELRFSTKTRAGIGTICHEFSHVLGLPDYYVTDFKYSYLEKYTPGAWSLMGYGNYLNNGNTPPNFSIYDKYYLGWVEPQILNVTDTLQLPADGATGYLLARNEMHSEAKACRTDTVYYIENRQQTGWDEYLPGHGMLIWRVMYDQDKWDNNSPNDFKTRYRLMCADENEIPFTYGDPRPNVPFPGNVQQTTFAPFEINGLDSIQEATDGMITFIFHTQTKTPVENVVVNGTADGVWYNLLGQPIDPAIYKGVAIHNKQKYLLR